MSTSIHSGLVDFGATLYGAANDPIDTVIMRDGVANGLLHAADSFAQVRVNYMAVKSTLANGQDAYETIESSPTAGTWYLCGGSPFGSWPLTLNETGTPYKLRIRVGVAASTSNADTLTLRVVLAPDGLGGRERDRSVDHVWETSWTASTTSTTPTWASGTSQGTAASATLLTVSQPQASSWRRNVSAFDAVSSASPMSVDQCLVAAYVYAKTTGTALPRLHALHIAEYVGT